MANNLDVSLRINVDKKEGETNLQAFNRAFNNVLKDIGKSGEEVQAFQKLRYEIDNGTKSVDELDAATASLYRQFKEGSQLAADRDLLGLKQHITIQKEIDETRAAYKRLKKSGTLTGEELAQAALKTEDRIKELKHQTNGWTDSIENAKVALAGVGAAGAGLITVTGQAIEFEAAMADVKKVVDGTPEQIESLGSRIKELATELPIGADGLAQIAAAGGQLGVPIEKLETFIQLSAKMATAFNLSAEEAGQAVATLSNVFNLPLENVEALGDAINTLGNTTAAKESQILDFLTRVGGTANQFGLTAEQASALGATLIGMGSSSEVAATGVNALLTKLQTANTQGASFQNALKSMGISATDLAAEIRANPQQALSEFLQQLDQLDQQAKAEILSKLFGQEYQDDIARLLNGLNQYDDALKRVSDSGATAGAMQKEFDAQMETTEAQLNRLTNGIEAIAINIGTALLPLLRPLIEGAGDVAAAIAKLVENNSEIAALVTVLGSAALAMSSLKTAGLALNVVWQKFISGSNVASTSVDGLASKTSKASAAMRLLGTAIPLAAFDFAYTQIRGLVDALNEHSEAAEALADVNKALDESQQQLANRYAEISEQTGVTVTSMKELDAAIANGSIVIDEASGKYLSAAQHQEQLAEKTAHAADAAKEMAYSQEELSEAYQAVNEKLKTSIDDNSKLASVMSGEVVTALKGGETGIAALVIALRNAEQQGSLTTDQINDGLGSALQGLSDEERTRFGELIKTAMDKLDAGAKGAGVSVEGLQKLLDQLAQTELEQMFADVGLSADVALGNVTEDAQTAANAIDGIAASLESTGVAAEQQSSIIEQALLGAIPKAQTTADIEIIASRLESLENSGRLGSDGVERVTAALQDQQSQINKTIPGIQSLEEAWEQLGLVDPEHLKRQAEQAREAFEEIRASGLYTAEQISDAWHAWADSASEVGDPVVDAMIDIESAAYGAADSMDAMADSASTATDDIDDLADSTSTATDDIDDLADSMERSKNAAESSGDAAESLGGSYLTAAGKAAELYEQLEQLLGPEAAAEHGSALKQQAENVDALAAAAEKSEAALNRLSKAGALALNGYARALQDAEIAYHQAVLAADSARGAVVSLAADAGHSARDIDKLADSTDDAADAFERMSDSAKSSLDSVRDSIFRLADDQERLNASRYEQDKAALKQQLAEAREQGNQQAVEDTHSALQLLEIYRELELQNEALADAEERLSQAREAGNESEISKLESEVEQLENAAEREADQAAMMADAITNSKKYEIINQDPPPEQDHTIQPVEDVPGRQLQQPGQTNRTTDPVDPAPVRVVRFEFPSGSAVDVVDNGSDDTLISELESFAQRSGA